MISEIHIDQRFDTLFNPIPTGHGRNQPIYECHVTTASRNRVNANWNCLQRKTIIFSAIFSLR